MRSHGFLIRKTILAVLLFFSGIHLAQENGKLHKIGVQVNLVSLDVEVLDKKGDPVTDLRQKDFVIEENDRPMEISNFAYSRDRLVSLAFVLDTSALSTDQLITAKRFIRHLAGALDAQDRFCLYSFDARNAWLEQDMTSDQRELWRALDDVGVPSERSGGLLQELFGKIPLTALAIDLALQKLGEENYGKKNLLLISNRFRGLGPATVEHVQASSCTLMTLEFNHKSSALVTLGGDAISKGKLLRESGGRQFPADPENMGPVCSQIAYSLKNCYSLGYLTEIKPEDKETRKIRIRIPGRKYTVNYRRTYSLR